MALPLKFLMLEKTTTEPTARQDRQVRHPGMSKSPHWKVKKKDTTETQERARPAL
jgi:hypothetical protein